MAIKYKSRWEEIEKVEIDRETDTSVWLKGEKYSVRKNTSWDNYHDTFEEAKDFIRQRELREIQNLESSIEYHREKIKKIEAIEAF